VASPSAIEAQALSHEVITLTQRQWLFIPLNGSCAHCLGSGLRRSNAPSMLALGGFFNHILVGIVATLSAGALVSSSSLYSDSSD
jgi:hypothetical protein